MRLTSPTPQLGFVRVSVQQTWNRITVPEASKTLAGTSRTTDAHLLQLVEANGAKLATLDTGIPGAFLIPAPVARPAGPPGPQPET